MSESGGLGLVDAGLWEAAVVATVGGRRSFHDGLAKIVMGIAANKQKGQLTLALLSLCGQARSLRPRGAGG